MITLTLSKADLDVIVGALTMMGVFGDYRPPLPYTSTSVNVLTSTVSELRDLAKGMPASGRAPMAFSVCELIIMIDMLAYAIALLKKDLIEHDLFLHSNPEGALYVLARLREMLPYEVSFPLRHASGTLLDGESMITVAGGLILRARRFRVSRSGPPTDGFVFYTCDVDSRQLVWWMYPQGVAPSPIATRPENLLRYYQRRLVTAYRDGVLYCAYLCGVLLVVHRSVSLEATGTIDPKCTIGCAQVQIPPIADFEESHLIRKWSWRSERLFTTDHVLFPRIESLEWLGREWAVKLAFKDGTLREVRTDEEFYADLGPCEYWIEY